MRGAVPVELDHGAVLAQDDRIRRHACLLCEARVRREHAVLAVDRHHAARTEQRDHRSQLIGVRVAGDVHGRVVLVQHLGAELRQSIDRVVDAQLVSGIGLAEMITVSPRSTLTAGWSLYAIRVSADTGSPWLPAQRIDQLVRRVLLESLRPDHQLSSGTSM